MMKKGFTPTPIGISSGYNQLVWGFTLLELVVVIIILGVLATLGFTQYGAMVEKARGAEARQIFGDIRNLAYAYRLANGTVTGMTDADVNIGTAADQIPSYLGGCRSSHYFSYAVWGYISPDPWVVIYAYRCSAGGKPPQGSSARCACLYANLVTGEGVFNGACCQHDISY